MVADRTYADGLIDGKIGALEATAANTTRRIDNHATRLRLLERALWITLGIVLSIEFLPKILLLINGTS
jgi:hypothetical protein